MTLQDFNLLTPKEKEIAAMNGAFIADRRVSGHTLALYAVGCFFVEVWYDNVQNEVTMLMGFDSGERLLPYVGNLEIDFL